MTGLNQGPVFVLVSKLSQRVYIQRPSNNTASGQELPRNFPPPFILPLAERGTVAGRKEQTLALIDRFGGRLGDIHNTGYCADEIEVKRSNYYL